MSSISTPSGGIELHVGRNCVPVTGAYCHAMSSRYNGLMRPPVVLIDDGNARLIVRRERLEDLLRADVLLGVVRRDCWPFRMGDV